MLHRVTRGVPYGNVQITIANSSFVSNSQCERYDLFDLNNVDLHLIGPVLFYNITNVGNVFSIRASNVTCLNYVKFALVEAIYIYFDTVVMKTLTCSFMRTHILLSLAISLKDLLRFKTCICMQQ